MEHVFSHVPEKGKIWLVQIAETIWSIQNGVLLTKINELRTKKMCMLYRMLRPSVKVVANPLITSS